MELKSLYFNLAHEEGAVVRQLLLEGQEHEKLPAILLPSSRSQMTLQSKDCLRQPCRHSTGIEKGEIQVREARKTRERVRAREGDV